MKQSYPGIGAHIASARFCADAAELQWVLRGVQQQDPEMFVVHIGRARDMLPIDHPF